MEQPEGWIVLKNGHGFGKIGIAADGFVSFEFIDPNSKITYETINACELLYKIPDPIADFNTDQRYTLEENFARWIMQTSRINPDTLPFDRKKRETKKSDAQTYVTVNNILQSYWRYVEKCKRFNPTLLANLNTKVATELLYNMLGMDFIVLMVYDPNFVKIRGTNQYDTDFPHIIHPIYGSAITRGDLYVDKCEGYFIRVIDFNSCLTTEIDYFMNHVVTPGNLDTAPRTINDLVPALFQLKKVGRMGKMRGYTIEGTYPAEKHPYGIKLEHWLKSVKAYIMNTEKLRTYIEKTGMIYQIDDITFLAATSTALQDNLLHEWNICITI